MRLAVPIVFGVPGGTNILEATGKMLYEKNKIQSIPSKASSLKFLIEKLSNISTISIYLLSSWFTIMFPSGSLFAFCRIFVFL